MELGGNTLEELLKEVYEDDCESHATEYVKRKMKHGTGKRNGMKLFFVKIRMDFWIFVLLTQKVKNYT
jgi:hypothetical protein